MQKEIIAVCVLNVDLFEVLNTQSNFKVIQTQSNFENLDESVIFLKVKVKKLKLILKIIIF